MNLSRCGQAVFNYLVEFDGSIGIHLFHTEECGRFDDGACPLIHEKLCMSAEDVALGIQELQEKKMAHFEKSAKEKHDGWVYGVLLVPFNRVEVESAYREIVFSEPKPKLKPEKRRMPTIGERFKIFQRDKFACVYCGRKSPDVELTADHVTPYCKGGLTVPENLVTACRDCNAGKAARVI